jgi:serine/threonine-protein kinase
MFCTRCGKKNVEGVRFCYACGHDLTQSTPPESMPSALPSGADAAGESVGDMDLTLMQAAEGAAAGLEPGTRIGGRYRIERKLGQGGMGSIYLATDERLELLVALKFINPALWQSQSAYRRFIKEAKVCLNLTHPNIVRVHFLDEWEGQAYLALEYLEGQTLRAFLDNQQGKPLEWKTVSAMMQQLLGAVGYAHARGVVHRDLKPGNVMLAKEKSGSWRLVVMDFGLAKMTEGDGQTRLGASLGTPYYMAPEQHGGAAGADQRADLYSLGVIAYEMLTGQLPVGRTIPPTELRPDLSKVVDAWVLKAIEYDPQKRFATAQEMLGALRAIPAEAPLFGEPEPRAKEADRAAGWPATPREERTPREIEEPARQLELERARRAELETQAGLRVSVPPPAPSAVLCKEARDALILAIVGLVCCGIILQPIAIYKALKARKQLSANPSLTGSGVATAALVISIIGLCLWVLWLIGGFIAAVMEAGGPGIARP